MGSNLIDRRRFLTTASSASLATLATGPSLRAAPITGLQPRSVIYVFLSGGLAQQDSFDMKPQAPRLALQ